MYLNAHVHIKRLYYGIHFLSNYKNWGKVMSKRSLFLYKYVEYTLNFWISRKMMSYLYIKQYSGPYLL